MGRRVLILRYLCLLGLAVWLGGFTFYGAAVVPVLHDELDHLQAGGITRRVTDTLNAFGAATLALWWLDAWAERTGGPAWAARARGGLLAASTAILAGLVALHRVMDARLDDGLLRGFYPLHRLYLWASTAQWLVHLALLAVALAAWTRPATAAGSEHSKD
jgi:hypothetical protein